MQIKHAEFIISNTDNKKCPKADMPENAFIGRSNVGKSSLINMLTERKSLAKVSGKPGKTQLINHFLINKSWYLVDLPGYGYASVSKTKRYEFAQFIKKYLRKRENLMCLFVLIDSRLKPQAIDLENCLIDFGDPSQIPFWGDPDDWGFDRKLSSWMYCGADEELEARFWKEWEAWMGLETDEDTTD